MSDRMNPGNPEHKTGGFTRRVGLVAGGVIGLSAALGLKPQEALAAIPAAISQEAPAVTPLTEALSGQVNEISLKLDQIGISGGPGNLYANAWVDSDENGNPRTRIPYEGIVFKQLPDGTLIPDQTLAQIGKKPGLNDGLSAGLINQQPVDTIPLPQEGVVEVDPAISTVVKSLGNLFNTEYSVTAAQANGPFNVFRVGERIIGPLPGRPAIEDSFALRQDLEGRKAGLISFANIAKPAEIAEIIPKFALFAPAEAGTGGGNTTPEVDPSVARMLEQTKMVNSITVQRNGKEYKVETRQAPNTPAKIVLQESLAQETADLIAESAEQYSFKNLYAVTLPSRESFPEGVRVFTSSRFINGKDTQLYGFGSQRIGDSVFYYFTAITNVANIPSWSLTGDILSTVVGNGDYNVGSHATNNVEKYNALITKTPFAAAT